MSFGELRSMLHRGELPPLFATLPEDQHGYAMRMAGSKITARQERLRLAGWLVYAEDPLSRDTRKKIDPALDPLLRWYACDVASETMRLYGNRDSRSLNAIEVSRKYVLGEVGEEELKEAHRATYAAAYDGRGAIATYFVASAAGYDAANSAAADAVYFAANSAAANASDAADRWPTRHNRHRTLLTNWFRTYLVRWIEEGPWWEVSS